MNAPSGFFIYQPWLREYITAGLYAGTLLINAETGERDFSMFGTYADEFKEHWDKYDKAIEKDLK